MDRGSLRNPATGLNPRYSLQSGLTSLASSRPSATSQVTPVKNREFERRNGPEKETERTQDSFTSGSAGTDPEQIGIGRSTAWTLAESSTSVKDPTNGSNIEVLVFLLGCRPFFSLLKRLTQKTLFCLFPVTDGSQTCAESMTTGISSRLHADRCRQHRLSSSPIAFCARAVLCCCVVFGSPLPLCDGCFSCTPFGDWARDRRGASCVDCGGCRNR